MSLYTLIETMLGPVLVFAGGFEAPPERTVYGGAILAVALVGHSIVSLREEYASSRAVAADGEAEQGRTSPMHSYNMLDDVKGERELDTIAV